MGILRTVSNYHPWGMGRVYSFCSLSDPMTTSPVQRLALAACPFPPDRRCGQPCETCQRTAVNVVAELVTVVRGEGVADSELLR
jgi:hypothetical protein